MLMGVMEKSRRIPRSRGCREARGLAEHLVLLPAKQAAFFSKEALPGETPANLGRRMNHGLKLSEQNPG